MQWYHVVVTRDNDTMKLFIDNNLVGFHTTGSNAGYMGTLHAFTIGSRGDTLSYNFIGDIDDVKVIDRVLTTAEVTLLDSTCNLFMDIKSHVADENFISVFPNPFTTDLVVNGITAPGDVLLFDLTGKEIVRQKTFISETRINTENLLPGIYFLRCSEENKTANIKLIKF
jgi:hypothetical protein